VVGWLAAETARRRKGLLRRPNEGK
jgi:hypothetical protein